MEFRVMVFIRFLFILLFLNNKTNIIQFFQTGRVSIRYSWLHSSHVVTRASWIIGTNYTTISSLPQFSASRRLRTLASRSMGSRLQCPSFSFQQYSSTTYDCIFHFYSSTISIKKKLIFHWLSNHNKNWCILFWFLFADIEAECQDDYMKIRVGFNGSFTGLLYSAGNWICYNACG